MLIEKNEQVNENLYSQIMQLYNELECQNKLLGEINRDIYIPKPVVGEDSCEKEELREKVSEHLSFIVGMVIANNMKINNIYDTLHRQLGDNLFLE